MASVIELDNKEFDVGSLDLAVSLIRPAELGLFNKAMSNTAAICESEVAAARCFDFNFADSSASSSLT